MCGWAVKCFQFFFTYKVFKGTLDCTQTILHERWAYEILQVFNGQMKEKYWQVCVCVMIRSGEIQDKSFSNIKKTKRVNVWCFFRSWLHFYHQALSFSNLFANFWRYKLTWTAFTFSSWNGTKVTKSTVLQFKLGKLIGYRAAVFQICKTSVLNQSGELV